MIDPVIFYLLNFSPGYSISGGEGGKHMEIDLDNTINEETCVILRVSIENVNDIELEDDGGYMTRASDGQQTLLTVVTEQ